MSAIGISSIVKTFVSPEKSPHRTPVTVVIQHFDEITDNACDRFASFNSP
jgi:hypothetical protein